MFQNDKATIHWSNRNLDNRLPSIKKRPQTKSEPKSRQETTPHNDKATIHWSNKNIDNIIPSTITRVPYIVVKKISTRDYIPS